MGSSKKTGADGTGKGTGIGIIIGGQSIGGPKGPPRNIGIKDMGGLNQSTIIGGIEELPGIKAGEIRRVMEDLKAGEVSERVTKRRRSTLGTVKPQRRRSQNGAFAAQSDSPFDGRVDGLPRSSVGRCRQPIWTARIESVR
jgi:hypothetical protein